MPNMQGNCSGPPPDLDLDPPRNEINRQCVIKVREDFLELPLHGSVVWISSLYVTLSGLETNHSTLVSVHGSDLYMTDMTFVANGHKARAIDVKENHRVYVGRASLNAIADTCMHA